MPPRHWELDKATKEAFKREAFNTTRDLFYGSIGSFVATTLLVISYSSPYWLQSWHDTQSPFVNMGLWEFCFYKFRHPDYQFDKLFHGCHPLYGDEYRLIREKLLPGWLMVVQLLVTVAVISGFIGQFVSVSLLLRYPLEWILRFEHQITFICVGLNIFAAVTIFLSLCVFGAECWNRDWLLYPNYNFVSYSYAMAVFACIGFIVATVFLIKEAKVSKERKMHNKELLMKLRPFLYRSSLSDYAPSFRSGGGSVVL